MKLGGTLKSYETNFGNSENATTESYSRVVIELDMKRDATLIFFKVTLGLFAAVLVALFSSLMPTESDDIFSARIGLLGGTLLAVVVNQQFADAKSGETTAVTLIDSLHMLGFISVLTLFLGTISSRYLATKDGALISHVFLDRLVFALVALLCSGLGGWWIYRSYIS
jgi:hypothetical protein